MKISFVSGGREEWRIGTLYKLYKGKDIGRILSPDYHVYAYVYNLINRTSPVF